MIDLLTTKWVLQKQLSFCNEIGCTYVEDNSSYNGPCAVNSLTWLMHNKLPLSSDFLSIVKYEQLHINPSQIIKSDRYWFYLAYQVWSNSSCLKAAFWAVFVLTAMFQNKSILTFEYWEREGPTVLHERHSVIVNAQTRQCHWTTIPCRTVLSATNGFNVCSNWSRLATPLL